MKSSAHVQTWPAFQTSKPNQAVFGEVVNVKSPPFAAPSPSASPSLGDLGDQRRVGGCAPGPGLALRPRLVQTQRARGGPQTTRAAGGSDSWWRQTPTLRNVRGRDKAAAAAAAALHRA